MNVFGSPATTLRCKLISELYFQSLEILRSPKYKGPYVQNKRNLKQSDFNEKWKLFFFQINEHWMI